MIRETLGELFGVPSMAGLGIVELGRRWPAGRASAVLERITPNVVSCALDTGNEGALREAIERELRHPAGRARPIDRAVLFDRPGGTLLLYRARDGAFDARDAMLSLTSNCWPPYQPVHVHPRVTLRGEVRAQARLAKVARDPQTMFRGRARGGHVIGWSSPIAFASTRTISRALSAPVEAVLLAALGGGLARSVAQRGTELTHRELHALLSRDTIADLRRVSLLTELADPLARVEAMRDRLQHLEALPRVPLFLEGRASVAVAITNAANLSLDGIPVVRELFWTPAEGALAVSFAIHHGTVTVGVVADASRVGDPEGLVRDIVAEHEQMLGEVGTRWPTASYAVSP